MLETLFCVSKKVRDMFDFEYILYCVENISMSDTTVSNNEYKKLNCRKYYSPSMVAEEGSQPQVLFKYTDGKMYTTPETHFEDAAMLEDSNDQLQREITQPWFQIYQEAPNILPAARLLSTQMSSASGMDESTLPPDLNVQSAAPSVTDSASHLRKTSISATTGTSVRSKRTLEDVAQYADHQPAHKRYKSYDGNSVTDSAQSAVFDFNKPEKFNELLLE